MKNNTGAAVKLSASLNMPKKSEQSFAPIIIKFTLALLGCLGSVFSFLSCFSVAVSNFVVVVSAVISCMVFTFTLSLKPKLTGIASLSAAGVFLVLTYIFRYEICGGIANTVSIYLSRIRDTFRSEPFIPLIEPDLSYYHSTVFFVFFTALLCMTTAYLTSRSCFAAGICFPILIPPIAALMFGLEPNYIAFTSVIAICAAALAFEISSSEKISTAKCSSAIFYSGFAAAAIAAVCFVVVTAAVKLLGYERPQSIDNIYNKITGHIENGDIQNAISDIVTVTIKKTGSGGAINHGKLGEFGDISFDNETVLQVTIPKSSDTIYLRGFVGSVYTGKSWEQLPNSKLRELNSITENFTNSGLSPLLLDSYNLKYSRDASLHSAALPQYSFAVKNIAANKDYLYMPYNLVPESVSRYTVRNDSSFGGNDTSYIGQYYDPSGYYSYQNLFRKKWSIPSSIAADEAAYRNFVYENYMDIPKSFDSAKIFDESYYKYITAEELMTGKSTLDEMTVFNRKLYYIKNWLKSNCEYSLSAGKLPFGEDFVNYFLENRKGSCSHFATTAAIMCRYAGIPARYVEGYVIKQRDFPASTQTGQAASVDVTDTRGHAWVEIYIDGFGWYPVEFTSGYGNIRTAIPTETIPVREEAETETIAEESEINSEQEDNSAAVTTAYNIDQDSNSAPATTVVQEASAEISGAETTTAPLQEQTAAETEGSEPQEKTVGFGIFGIKGENHVDIYYDITPLFIGSMAVLLVPALVILRRIIIIMMYRKRCVSGKRSAALAAYKKFGKLIRIMKLPQQGGLDYGEYEKTLSDRTSLLSDGTAQIIINTALKATFGGAHLTSDDTEEAVFAVNSLTKRYYGTQNKFGKFLLKYFYCVL